MPIFEQIFLNDTVIALLKLFAVSENLCLEYSLIVLLQTHVWVLTFPSGINNTNA
jgi:hypothetical protein